MKSIVAFLFFCVALSLCLAEPHHGWHHGWGRGRGYGRQGGAPCGRGGCLWQQGTNGPVNNDAFDTENQYGYGYGLRRHPAGPVTEEEIKQVRARIAEMGPAEKDLIVEQFLIGYARWNAAGLGDNQYP